MLEKRLKDGFLGEIMYVVPRPLLANVTKHPLVNPLTPTDIGWFPTARYHYRERPTGAPEHILILCVKGSGWFEIAGKRRSINSGEVLVIPKGTSHVYGAAENQPWSIHWVHFVGTVGDYYVNQVKQDEFTLSIDVGVVATLEMLFTTCRDAFIANFVLQRMIYASQALHLLLGCLFFNNRAFSPLLQSSRFHSIDDTLTYLHDNIGEKLTLDMMAKHAGLSKSHFVRLFKEQTHFSPIAYFIQLKMQRACMLLSSTYAPVKEISLELGFEDPYYFSRLFSKTVGMSPIQYRENPYNGKMTS